MCCTLMPQTVMGDMPRISSVGHRLSSSQRRIMRALHCRLHSCLSNKYSNSLSFLWRASQTCAHSYCVTGITKPAHDRLAQDRKISQWPGLQGALLEHASSLCRVMMPEPTAHQSWVWQLLCIICIVNGSKRRTSLALLYAWSLSGILLPAS